MTENGLQLLLLVTRNAKEYQAKRVQAGFENEESNTEPPSCTHRRKNFPGERINRRPVDKIRATLPHSKIHALHWQYVLQHAVYKYIITFHHRKHSIPHTQWYDAEPRVHKIFTFGQLGYTPILKVICRSYTTKQHHLDTFTDLTKRKSAFNTSKHADTQRSVPPTSVSTTSTAINVSLRLSDGKRKCT